MGELYIILDAFVVTGLLVLSFVSFLGGGHRYHTNRLFALFSLFVAMWVVSNHISNDVTQPAEVAVRANYFVFSCSFGAMILIMKLIAYMVHGKNTPRVIKFTEPLLWLMFVLAATPLVGAGVERQEEVYAVIFGPATGLYGLLLLAMATYTYVLLFQGRKNLHGVQKHRLRTVGIALSVALPLVILLSFVMPSLLGAFNLTEIGIAPMAIIVIAFYYSAVRHGMFDIKSAVVRSIAYALSLATLAIVYFVSVYLVSILFFKDSVSSGVSFSPINIGLALVLAFIFQPIKQFFDKITDSIFFRDRYNTDDFIARISEVLTTTTDLRSLLQRAAREIGDTLKAEQAFFYVEYGSKHITAGTDRHTSMPLHDVEWLKTHVTTDSVQVATTFSPDSHMHRLMASHKVAAIMPLIHGEKTVGYLALGEQRTNGYTTRDIKVLAAISDELVIAIQNSLSVQEVKDINANLEQRIEAATAELRTSNARLKRIDASKDEFISMASHQLRTPLTSIKGYLSMVLEGDTGKITSDQRHLLQEAFTSSERMVHLIHDFLNVSRLQNGKFMLEQHPYDLVALVHSDTNSLQRSAETRGLALVCKTSLKQLVLMIDETKVRQVVMNFIDNALYYSRPDGKITVKLDKVGDNVELRVIDNGIGVPKAEQEHLFTKFFRAANARKQRPDGTGVGIFLAKKVVNEHGGEIIFESTEGVGSTFGFTLPIAKLLPSDAPEN